jgi:hypothetical protein
MCRIYNDTKLNNKRTYQLDKQENDWKDSSQKKKYKWPINTLENVQCL